MSGRPSAARFCDSQKTQIAKFSVVQGLKKLSLKWPSVQVANHRHLCSQIPRKSEGNPKNQSIVYSKTLVLIEAHPLNASALTSEEAEFDA
jgi:hypothetical protein